VTPRQIKALRKRFGDTQTEFYDRLGMKGTEEAAKRQFVRRLEKGERDPSKATIALLEQLAASSGL
jgi:transcriptional regulator with XRE-family HTH domain